MNESRGTSRLSGVGCQESVWPERAPLSGVCLLVCSSFLMITGGGRDEASSTD